MDAAVNEVAVWLKGEGPVVIDQYLDCFEVFCGTGGITRALIARGFKARGFDRPRGGATLVPSLPTPRVPLSCAPSTQIALGATWR
eukprot:2612161-Pyramimonas_sp.AAC.1